MNKELYITTWKKLANEKKLHRIDFYYRAIFLACNSKSNQKFEVAHILLEKYFSPIKNKNKIESNGNDPFFAININDNYLFMRQQTVRGKYSDATLLGEPISNFMTEEEFQEFKELSLKIDRTLLHRKYVHYFTAKSVGFFKPMTTLTFEQMAVQSAHVTMKLGYEMGKAGIKCDPDNTYFKWYSVDLNTKFSNIIRELEKKNYKVVKFYESDLRNHLTAIAFYPVPWYKKADFEEFELMKF